MQWNESGGPSVEPPRRQGFGLRAFERMLAIEIQASAELTFARAGFSCVITAPVGKKSGMLISAGCEGMAPADEHQVCH